MPRGPAIIFEETVVAGTILRLTPFLKARRFVSFESSRELGRALVFLKELGSIAGDI
jgi:hypothetical protein